MVNAGDFVITADRLAQLGCGGINSGFAGGIFAIAGDAAAIVDVVVSGHSERICLHQQLVNGHTFHAGRTGHCCSVARRFDQQNITLSSTHRSNDKCGKGDDRCSADFRGFVAGKERRPAVVRQQRKHRVVHQWFRTTVLNIFPGQARAVVRQRL